MLVIDRMLPPQTAGETKGLAERLADEQQDMQAILWVFSRLPKHEPDVLSLCIWMGLSYEEAAAALDVPIGTVRSRLSRGRRRFRDAFGPLTHRDPRLTTREVAQRPFPNCRNLRVLQNPPCCDESSGGCGDIDPRRQSAH